MNLTSNEANLKHSQASMKFALFIFSSQPTDMRRYYQDRAFQPELIFSFTLISHNTAALPFPPSGGFHPA